MPAVQRSSRHWKPFLLLELEMSSLPLSDMKSPHCLSRMRPARSALADDASQFGWLVTLSQCHALPALGGSLA